jgi:hypothetical protein
VLPAYKRVGAIPAARLALPAATAGFVVQRIEIRVSLPRGRCAATKAKTASRARAVLGMTSSMGNAARTAQAVRRRSVRMGVSGFKKCVDNQWVSSTCPYPLACVNIPVQGAGAACQGSPFSENGQPSYCDANGYQSCVNGWAFTACEPLTFCLPIPVQGAGVTLQWPWLSATCQFSKLFPCFGTSQLLFWFLLKLSRRSLIISERTPASVLFYFNAHFFISIACHELC